MPLSTACQQKPRTWIRLDIHNLDCFEILCNRLDYLDKDVCEAVTRAWKEFFQYIVQLVVWSCSKLGHTVLISKVTSTSGGLFELPDISHS